MTRQMPPAKLVAGVLAVTAVVLAAVLLIGSDEDDGGGAVPAGFTVFEGSFAGTSFSFAYPAEWGDVTEREGDDARERFFEAFEPEPEGSAGSRSSISLGVREDTASPEAILQANLTAARAFAAEDLEISEQGEAEVDGAAAAERASYTYTVPDASGDSAEGEGEIVVAATAERTALSLIITSSSASDLDIQAVADSLRIESPEESLGTEA
jgi:hypothetical protein